jgi:hypothetical protein
MGRAGSTLILVVCLVAITAAPAAGAKPVRGCANEAFELMSMEAFRTRSLGVGVPADILFTPEWEAGWAFHDKNGDGNLCVMDLPDTPGTLFGWIFNVVDNTSNH